MYKFINQLSSYEDINKLLNSQYNKGYELMDTKGQFLIFEKQEHPQKWHFNVSFSTTNVSALKIQEHGRVFSYYATQKKDEDILALKEYYDTLNVNYKKITLYFLIALLIVTVFTGFVPLLPPAIGGWFIGLLMSISVIRSVNQRRYTRRLYVPFLREHGFLNKELQNRFILKSHHEFNEAQMNRFRKLGELSYLKEIEGYHFYQLLALEERNTIIQSLVGEEKNTIEVLATVKE